MNKLPRRKFEIGDFVFYASSVGQICEYSYNHYYNHWDYFITLDYAPIWGTEPEIKKIFFHDNIKYYLDEIYGYNFEDVKQCILYNVWTPFEIITGTDYLKDEEKHLWWIMPSTKNDILGSHSISLFIDDIPTQRFHHLTEAIDFASHWTQHWLKKNLTSFIHK